MFEIKSEHYNFGMDFLLPQNSSRVVDFMRGSQT